MDKQTTGQTVGERLLALRIQNKLMQLSELYGVSIDYLMKGDKALDNLS